MPDEPMPSHAAGSARPAAAHASSPPPAAPPSVTGGDNATELVRLLSLVNRRMQRLVEVGRAEAELPSMAWQLMHAIDRHPGITLGELARASELSKGRTSVLVDGLVRLGYVAKCDDASDGRLTRLYTTERMAEVWDWYEGRYAAVVNELLSDLDGWERAALVGILRRLRTSAESRGWQP